MISEDGKVLTVVPDYGKSQFFISVEKIAVVGTEPLLEVAENLQQIPGAIGRVNQQLVLTSVDKTKVAVKAIDIAPDLQGDISHGVHIIDENTILLGSDSGLKVWDVKTGGSIAVGGEPAQYASNPIVLADGRILVLGYDSTWKIFLLE